MVQPLVHTDQRPLERARALVLQYGWNAMSYQVLNPSMRLWFSAAGDAVIGYALASGYRVVAGAPVCAPERLSAVVSEFVTDSHGAGLRVCYFGAEARLISLLGRTRPVAQVLLGAQPVWHPQNWLAVLARKPSVRAQINRARNKGVRVVPWSVDHATHNPALSQCLRAWLATRGLPPMRFLVEPDILARLEGRQVFVAEASNGVVVGFLIASPVPLRDGWLFEQVIRAPTAPNGTAELLVDAAMRAIGEQGAQYVTLGLAPLSRAGNLPAPPLPLHIALLLYLVRRHAQRFYNFAGLDRFKAKFQPDHWDAIYAIADEPRPTLRLFYAIAGAFGGVPPPLFIAHALYRAALQELNWATKRK